MIELAWQEYRKAVYSGKPDERSDRQLRLTFYAGFKKALDCWSLSNGAPMVLAKAQEEFAQFLTTVGKS